MVKLFVEGGGDSKELKIRCRRGFRQFLEKSGLSGKMPTIAACGGRRFAFDDFCVAKNAGESAVLLVDSESKISDLCQTGVPAEWRPWQHLRDRQGDGWERPAGASEIDCHLMVECMESWLISDTDVLAQYFAHGFHANSLPASQKPIEDVTKKDALAALKSASRACIKKQYDKGSHSFEILGLVDPAKVTSRSPWAARFVTHMKTISGA